MVFFLDGFYEDFNWVYEKLYVELKDSDGWLDWEVVVEVWDNYLRRNRLIVVDLFYG